MTTEHVSPDGRWRWDGQAWQPVPGVVQTDDGLMWWDGYRWRLTAAGQRARQRLDRADLMIPLGGFLLVPAIALLAFIAFLIIGAFQH